MTDGRKAFTPNPLLAGMWGLCPIIAADRSLPEGLALGIGAVFCSLVLAGSIPLARGIVPQRLRPALSLSLSAATAVLYSLAFEVYSPSLARGLWIFLPLLAVCATSLHTIKRCSAEIDDVASKERCVSILKEALIFFITAFLIGAFREIAGRGTLTIPLPSDAGLRLIDMNARPLRLFSSPAGGFILVGCFAAAYRFYLRIARRRAL
jgi:electron transport complex protein RnfE